MRLRQQVEPAAPALRLPAGRTEDESVAEAPPIARTTPERLPLSLRSLRALALLTAALAIGGAVTTATTGVGPLEWAKAANPRSAYGAGNLRYIQSQALTSLGLVEPALAAYEAVPTASRDEAVMEALWPRLIARGDPELLLRAAAATDSSTTRDWRLQKAVTALYQQRGADNARTLLATERYAAVREKALGLLIAAEATRDLESAHRHIAWLPAGTARALPLKTIVVEGARQRQWDRAFQASAQDASRADRKARLVALLDEAVRTSELTQAGRALRAARGLFDPRQYDLVDVDIAHAGGRLAVAHWQRGELREALAVLEATPRGYRGSGYQALAQAITGVEPEADTLRVYEGARSEPYTSFGGGGVGVQPTIVLNQSWTLLNSMVDRQVRAARARGDESAARRWEARRIVPKRS